LEILRELKKPKLDMEGFNKERSITVATIVTIRLKPINLLPEVIKKE
jgi:hypothetical protein